MGKTDREKISGKYIKYDDAYKLKTLTLYKEHLFEKKCTSRKQFCRDNGIPYQPFGYWVIEYPELIELEKKVYGKRKKYTTTIREPISVLEDFSTKRPLNEERNDSKGKIILEEVIQAIKNSGLIKNLIVKSYKLMRKVGKVKPKLKKRQLTIRSKKEIENLLIQYAQEVYEHKIKSREEFSKKNGVKSMTFHKWVKKIPKLIELERTYSKYSRYDHTYKLKTLRLYKQNLLERKCKSRAEFCRENNIKDQSFRYWIQQYPELLALEEIIYDKYTNTMREPARVLENSSTNHAVNKELNDLKEQKTLEEVTQAIKNLSLNEEQKTIAEVIQATKNLKLNEEQKLRAIPGVNKISNLLGTDLNTQTSLFNRNNQPLDLTVKKQPTTQNQKNSFKEIVDQGNHSLKRKREQLVEANNGQINSAQGNRVSQPIDSTSLSLVKKPKTAWRQKYLQAITHDK
ncbi:hypothetical protein ACTNBL_03275 [Enterococcus villorum]|uniref:Uncharacterized protein n=2 Tax=Enterococcus villorum TaxID=112904 RepID=A0A511IYP7_9ENTE|nr:hypothetical protein [Enterococcus villorum]EOH89965.1 hypothetical protein UAO_01209 [Enterococcus villorum ATCC 700913]EOW78197.1 hypothetical protein I591_01052 [Enterococcus villorum ATCC 700913]GEL90910.1 hypothetical protein EVI01_02470 [Enterococcus villorum]